MRTAQIQEPATDWLTAHSEGMGVRVPWEKNLTQYLPKKVTKKFPPHLVFLNIVCLLSKHWRA
jgi:hypothetical protein